MDSFKSQIIHIVRTVDKLDLPDRTEALGYLQKITEAFKNDSLSSDLLSNDSPISSTQSGKSNKTFKHKCKNHLCLNYNIKHLKKIACCKCNMKLGNETQLFEHLQIHLDYPLSCIHCRCLFRNIEDFSSHMIADCKQENEEVKNSEKYYCNVCSNSFINKKMFQSHLLENHGMKLYNNWYSCKLCNKMFEQKKPLFHHYKSAHSEMNHQWNAKQEKKGATELQENETDPIELPKFQCYHCNKTFEKKNMLSVHVKRHLKNNAFICDLCKRSFTCYKYYRRHLQTVSHQNKDGSGNHPLFKCDKCDNKVFTSRDALAQHQQRSHQPCDKRLKCPLCDFRTSLSVSLTRHINLHTDNRKFICDQCGACFHTSSALKEHTICIHSNERNYSCEICGQRFKLKSGLNRHFKTHSNEKEFKCFCGQVYKYRTNLRRHLATRHNVKNQKNRVFRITTEDEGYAMNNPKVVQQKAVKQKKVESMETNRMENFDLSSLNILSDVALSCADEVTDEVLRQTYDNLAKYSTENDGSQENLNSILAPVNNIIDRVLQVNNSDLRNTRLATPNMSVVANRQYTTSNEDAINQQLHLPPINYRPTCRQFSMNTIADLPTVDSYSSQNITQIENNHYVNSFHNYSCSQYFQDLSMEDKSAFSYTPVD